MSEYKRSGYSWWLALSLLARALPAFDSLLYACNHLNSIYPTFLRTLLIIFFLLLQNSMSIYHTSSLILDNEDVWCKKKENLSICKIYSKDLAEAGKIFIVFCIDKVLWNRLWKHFLFRTTVAASNSTFTFYVPHQNSFNFILKGKCPTKMVGHSISSTCF